MGYLDPADSLPIPVATYTFFLFVIPVWNLLLPLRLPVFMHPSCRTPRNPNCP